MQKTTLILFITIAILNFTLVFIWFKDGYILGTAEAVIPFYNSERYFQQVKDAWADNNPGLGLPNGIITAYAPTYFILSQFQKMGFSGFMIEASFFWFLLTSAGVGILFLVRELFPKIHGRFILIAILFYYFNPISLINVWNRFLFNYMVFWAVLPLVTFLFIKGLNSRNYIFAFWIGIISLIYSLALSVLAFDILLWFLLLYITIFWIVTKKEVGKKLFFIKFFFLTIIYFCIINFWWISQVVSYLNSGKYTADLASFFDQDLTTLTSLSKSLGKLTDVIVFKHGTFFSTPAIDWARLYETYAVIFIEFLISAIMLFYLIKNRKNFGTIFLGTTLFLGIFLAKGNSLPLGEIFQFFFERINILHAFRNPFEKFGFIIILAAAPLLAASLEYIWETLKKYGKFVYIFCFLAISILYGYPYFSGLVFTSSSPPNDDYKVGYKVKVPKYYEEANNWLISNGKNFRFIGFPLKDQGITYNWEKGYQGIEPSSLLFSTPNILFNTTVPFYDQVSKEQEKLLLTSGDFSKVASALNARYVMVRSDVDFKERGLRDPKSLELRLTEIENIGGFKKVAEFGKLKFWENTSWEDKKFYLLNKLVKVHPNSDISNFTLFNSGELGFYNGNSDHYLDDFTNFILINPQEEKISDYKSKIYTFNIEQEGSYEVMLDTSIIRNFTINTVVIIDKSIQLNNSTPTEDGKVNFGEINLSKGNHQINVLTQYTEDLVNLPTNSNIRIKNEDGINLINFNPYNRYFLKFDYQILPNSMCQIIIYQDNDQIRNGKIVTPFIRGLPNNTSTNSFQTYQDYFEPRDTATWAQLSFICSKEEGIIVRNVEVKGLLEPKPILIGSNNSKFLDRALPKITYQINDNMNYRIKITDSQEPFILVFSELYDNGWKLKFDNNLIADKHFLINSYANGWLIEKEGDFDLILEFAPQKLLNWGRIISLVAFLGGVILIFLSLLSNKFIK